MNSIVKTLFLAGMAVSSLKALSLGKLETVMEAAVQANNEILSSPPLPLLEFKKGAKQFSVVGASYNVVIDGSTAEDPGAVMDGNLAGNGLSLNYSWAVSKSWGYFLFGTYNGLTGDLEVVTDNGGVVSMADDAVASFFAVGAGVMYNLVDTDFLSIPVFIGPMVGQMNFQASASQSTGGSLNADFDMSANPMMIGAIGGVQVAMKFSEYLAVIPYAIFGGDFTDSCKDWEATEVRIDGPLASQSSRECGGPGEGGVGGTTENKISLDNTIMAFGVNLAIPKLGVSIGVLAGTDTAPDSENISIQKVQLGISL